MHNHFRLFVNGINTSYPWDSCFTSAKSKKRMAVKDNLASIFFRFWTWLQFPRQKCRYVSVAASFRKGYFTTFIQMSTTDLFTKKNIFVFEISHEDVGELTWRQTQFSTRHQTQVRPANSSQILHANWRSFSHSILAPRNPGWGWQAIVIQGVRCL
jgi:hypothetical protein